MNIEYWCKELNCTAQQIEDSKSFAENYSGTVLEAAKIIEATNWSVMLKLWTMKVLVTMHCQTKFMELITGKINLYEE